MTRGVEYFEWNFRSTANSSSLVLRRIRETPLGSGGQSLKNVIKLNSRINNIRVYIWYECLKCNREDVGCDDFSYILQIICVDVFCDAIWEVNLLEN